MKKLMLILGAMLILLAGLAVIGCGNAENEVPPEEEIPHEQEIPERGGMSPGEVVKAFYEAANAGDYEKAKSYVFSESIEFWEEIFGEEGLKKVITQENTLNGTIQQVRIISEEIQGEFVIVDFVIYFKDGLEVKANRCLRIENGVWKLSDI